MEHRTLTIMFSDIRGFTSRTSSQSRAATADMIKQHNDLLLPVILERGGNLVKTIGDSFLVTFESPTDAVLAGIALQDTLRKFNSRTPAKFRIEIRVAISTGEVIVEEGDVFGEAVNIASRIEGIAEPNEIYFTESTYLSMNKAEVPSAEIGYRMLRGIPERIKIYQVLKEVKSPRPRTIPVLPITVSGRRMAPGWRRIAAFGIDAVLIGLISGALLANEWLRLFAERDKLNTHANEIHALLTDQATADKHRELSRLQSELRERERSLSRKLQTLEQRRNRLAQIEERLQRQREDLERQVELFTEGEEGPIQSHQIAGSSRFDEEYRRREIALNRRMKRLEQGRERLSRFEAELSDEHRTLTQEAQRLTLLYDATEGSGDPELMIRIDQMLWGREPPPVGTPHYHDISVFRAFASYVSARDGTVKSKWVLMGAVLFLIYSGILLGWKGRTFGKMLLKLRVYGTDGKPVSLIRSVCRCILYILSALPLGLGFIWMFVDRNHQGWHDKLTETQVVFEE